MQLFKKTISLLLVIVITGTFLFGNYPTVNAQTPGELTPVKVADSAQRSLACGVSVLGLCVPFTSLNSFAYFIGRAMIQQLTASIVNWINSGFDGNPSFVTDPGGLFTDIVNEEIGKMIQGSTDLNFLCSQFNIDIRLALAFKYRPFKKKVSCTLADVISHSQNALAGASINGFTAGDFRQGGWPAFVTMTEEQQNNIYGAYIEANDQLSINIGNVHKNMSNEINQGKGFLSWKKCTTYQSDLQGPTQDGGSLADAAAANTASIQGPTPSGASAGDAANASNGGKGPCLHEEVQTPGTVIESQLETQLGTGIRQLELADSFNEIVNALVAQLVKQVLTAGLRAASGSSASDTGAYLNELQNSQKQQAEQVKAIKDNVTPSLNTAIAVETTIRNNKNISASQLVASKNLLLNVRNCYTEKLTTTSYQQYSVLNQKIAIIDDTIASRITAVSPAIVNDLNSATSNLTQLSQVQEGLRVAQNANDTYYPIQNFTNLTQSGTLHTQADAAKSQTERDQIVANMQALNADSNNSLKECQLLP